MAAQRRPLAFTLLLAQVGVRCVPTRRRRGPGQTHAGRVLKALRADYGDGHLVFVLRAIAQSKGNRMALWSEVILAVSDIVVAREDWAFERAADFLDAFDDLPLDDLRRQAVARRPWPVRGTLRVLIYAELEQRLASFAEAAAAQRAAA